jgi:hypothetical protein
MASKLVGDDGELNDGPAFPLPNDLRIPEHAPDPSALIRDLRDGLHGASLTRAHARLAATGVVAGQSVVAILGPEAERVRAELDTWLGPGCESAARHLGRFDSPDFMVRQCSKLAEVVNTARRTVFD